MPTHPDTITERNFTITIECNNAAFDDDACGPELARILRELADELESGGGAIGAGMAKRLYDINGNRVGAAEMFAQDYRR